jgi:hypothetical protein
MVVCKLMKYCAGSEPGVAALLAPAAALLLVDLVGGRMPRWDTNTAGKSHTRCTLQTRCNLHVQMLCICRTTISGKSEVLA